MSPTVRGDRDCTLCSLNEEAEHVCLMGRGPIPSEVMIVGEAPGYREDDIGKPFQGASGKLLDEVLLSVGVNRDDVYITNAVRCRPPDNRTPSRTEIKACDKWLRKEIRVVRPQFILVLGATSMKALVGNTGVGKHRGKVLEGPGYDMVVSYHPAAILRNPSLKDELVADFTRFFRLASGDLGDDHRLNLTLVNDRDSFLEMLNDLEKAEVISYDLETSSLDEKTGRIYCIGLATPQRQYVVACDYPGSRLKGQVPKIIEAISKRCMGKKLVAHNSKFDNKWLIEKGGWDVRTTFDTMLASYVLNENRKHGLKNLARVFFQAPEYDLPQPVNPKKVPFETLAEYCAWDVYFTMKLYETFKPELIEDPQLKAVFTKLLLPVTKALEYAESHGVYIDRSRLARAMEINAERIEKVEDKLNEGAGRVLNWNSPQQVGGYLFHDLDLPVIEKTKTGKPSTAESVLLQLRKSSPVVDDILKYREYTKLGQFMSSWTEHMGEDSRMRPGFLVHGTVTGRLSCRNPNLQQVPRDKFIRSLITAPKGKVFVEADYSQVELRVASLIAREDRMRQAFQTGQDIHRITASAVMGIPEEEVTKDERKKAKAVNFGFLYGMGAPKFQEYARDKYDVQLDKSEAEDFRDRFFSLYPNLLNWHERQRRIAKKYGYVRTPLGRKRRLPDVHSPDRFTRGEAERQAINSPVQSFASDLTLLSMVMLSSRFSSSTLQVVGLVHDSILLEIDASDIDAILGEVQHVMEHEVVEYVRHHFKYDITVPLEVEIKYGPWGEGVIWDGS